MHVSRGELRDAVKKIKSAKAPGPDGVPGRAWRLAHKDLQDEMRDLYTLCLREGKFFPVWKEANIVLLPKEGKPRDQPSAYRPICLLDEAGKILERIICDRIVWHLARKGPNLDEDQYGLRVGRSTIDAVKRVRSIAESVMEEGGVLLAVSLDISNAFNTLPWRRVGAALEYHQVPPYLIAMVRDYFRDRKVTYYNRDAERTERRMSCGVPQGSVLGPLLWNITYDVVLRTALPSGCHVVCYADDTLILVGERNWGEAIAKANLATGRVVNTIRR
ncbi:reverse transcriptase [Lasius niger]|uniref:Reverse transcriptase n=1 Tax=Lasius niger TaxID=67767 RepID=A0A0J7KL94_LASNI|nr:reverse transcriptase [Lasius niger]